MDGVVFDFDGVICDSMRQHAEAYRRLLAGRATFTDRDVYLLEGARSETIIAQLLGDDRDARPLADEKQRIFRALGTPRLYPGAAELVQATEAPKGLVTGTRRENLEHLIPDLLPRFSAILAQADYTHDKPHPEPYARAATALDMAPDRLLCIENAPRGVQSARAAGYGEVWGIGTTVSEEDLQADRFFSDHAALARALADTL